MAFKASKDTSILIHALQALKHDLIKGRDKSETDFLICNLSSSVRALRAVVEGHSAREYFYQRVPQTLLSL